MPTLARLLCLALAALPACLAAQPRGSADWIQANAVQLNGQKVSVDVSSIDPGRVDGDAQWVYLWLRHDGSWSSVSAVVPQTETARLCEHYGVWKSSRSSRRTKRLEGIVRLTDYGTVFLEIGNALQAAEERPRVTKSGKIVRTWTAADGRKIEAEYIRATSAQVTIRRTSDNALFTIALDTLSVDDREWIATQR